MKVIIFGVLFLVLAVGNCFAAKVKSENELQEVCNKKASGYLSSRHIVIRKFMNEFTNHYNKKDNACYVSINKIYSHDSIIWQLEDIDKNSVIGEFVENTHIFICYVGDKSCKTESEYKQLIKAYLTQ